MSNIVVVVVVVCHVRDMHFSQLEIHAGVLDAQAITLEDVRRKHASVKGGNRRIYFQDFL